VKKTISCLRCGKREGFRKSHEKIKYKDDVLYLCVDCAQIAYKMKDAVIDMDSTLADELARDFVSLPEKPSKVLLSWFDEYKTRIGYPPPTNPKEAP